MQDQSKQVQSKQEFAEIEKQLKGEMRGRNEFVPDPDYISRTTGGLIQSSLLLLLHASIQFTARSKRETQIHEASKSFFSIFNHLCNLVNRKESLFRYLAHHLARSRINLCRNTFRVISLSSLNINLNERSSCRFQERNQGNRRFDDGER